MTRLKWKVVSVLLDIVLILTQDRCMVCVERTNRLENHFGCTRWNSEVTWVIWNLTSFYLEILLVSMQDRCMVCSRHNKGLEIVLDALDGTTR